MKEKTISNNASLLLFLLLFLPLLPLLLHPPFFSFPAEPGGGAEGKRTKNLANFLFKLIIVRLPGLADAPSGGQ